MSKISKPTYRSPLRKLVGKEYFILKRKWQWFTGSQKWSKTKSSHYYSHSVFQHKSFIKRPLKDVEMYLQENKKVNLQIAIQKLDTLIIQPKETFSIWKNVGRPTKNKGYLEGLVLNQGKIDKDTGGGLCQLGNLLFWIFAHSPLSITERHRHGFDVFPDINRKVPFGAGATLSYNYIDLQVINETENSFQLKLWIEDGYLYGELFSKEKVHETYSIEERNHRMKQQFWGGYSRHNEIYKIKQEGEHTEETKIVENHAIMMYNPFIESNKN